MLVKKYGEWAGNPKGTREDPSRCVVEVSGGYRFFQCRRARGHGENNLYCKQHARMAQAGRHLRVPKEEK